MEGCKIKTLYLIRHAKSDWKDGSLRDFQRGLTKKGFQDLETMSSYLALRNINPDLILSSAALRAQLTTDKIAEKMEMPPSVEYMNELYLTSPEMHLNVLSLQDNSYNSIMIVGHNPALSELVNMIQDENFTKFPTLGILAIDLEIDNWEDVTKHPHGKIDFFIFPKQFRYYMPKDGKTRLS